MVQNCIAKALLETCDQGKLKSPRCIDKLICSVPLHNFISQRHFPNYPVAQHDYRNQNGLTTTTRHRAKYKRAEFQSNTLFFNLNPSFFFATKVLSALNYSVHLAMPDLQVFYYVGQTWNPSPRRFGTSVVGMSYGATYTESRPPSCWTGSTLRKLGSIEEAPTR